ncbi:MAG TPA: phosphatidylglycerophosphatase A [Patescibacteria group bacterium]|nr:phosphatidylglycerophosphatase A [Patescibacteria group bacterium]
MRVLTSPYVIVSTFFGIGYLPFVPGTFGSIAGVLLFFLMRDIRVYAAITAVILIAGFLTAGKTERALAKKDPSCVVIDEVAGMLLTLACVPPRIDFAVIAFFLFRLLDTVKPYPADRLQLLKGSAGIMVDDIIAAVYANVVLQVVMRLASVRGS